MNETQKTAFRVGFVASWVLWWLCYAWQGWLGSIIWRWFAVGIFGAPALTTWQTAALICTIHYFAPTQIRTPDPERTWATALGEIIGYGFISPLVTFVSAALIHWILR